MKELAQDFDIDGKTAWEYLQKLQQAGLLLHNGRRSAAVRYRLADAFLKVRLAALDPPGGPGPGPGRTPRIPGPGSWSNGWRPPPGSPSGRRAGPICAVARRPEIINHLKNAAVLEEVCQSDRQTLLRLRRQWLQE